MAGTTGMSKPRSITTLSTLGGTVFGALAMYYTIYDRAETRIRAEVNTESRISRLEERVEALSREVWARRDSAYENNPQTKPTGK